jgi:predicted deacylase
MATRWSSHGVLEQVGPVAVAPGALRRGTLRAGLADVPLLVFGGGAPGPVLYVQALQHGLELNGVEVMRRLVTTLDAGALHGTLILVPMANTLAARVHMQSYPYADRPHERRLNDMNRRWSTPVGGANHVDRVVAVLEPLVRLADAVIDLHCHEYLYAPMALTDAGDGCCRELVLAAGFEVVHSTAGTEGMFGRYCRATLGKPEVTIEMPPLRRVDPRSSAIGYRGVLNMMRHLGMLEGRLELPPRTLIYGSGAGKSQSFKAEREGYIARLVEPGQDVKAGDLAAEIWSPDTFEPVQSIHAPFDGVVTSIGRPPQLWGEPEQDFINIGENALSFAVPGEIVDPARELGGVSSGI